MQRTLTIISCFQYIFWQDSVAPAFSLFLPAIRPTKSGTQCEFAYCVNICDKKLRRIRRKQIAVVVSFVACQKKLLHFAQFSQYFIFQNFLLVLLLVWRCVLCLILPPAFWHIWQFWLVGNLTNWQPPSWPIDRLVLAKNGRTRSSLEEKGGSFWSKMIY